MVNSSGRKGSHFPNRPVRILQGDATPLRLLGEPAKTSSESPSWSLTGALRGAHAPGGTSWAASWKSSFTTCDDHLGPRGERNRLFINMVFVNHPVRDSILNFYRESLCDQVPLTRARGMHFSAGVSTAVE